MMTFLTRRFSLISLIVALLATGLAMAIANQHRTEGSWTADQGAACNLNENRTCLRHPVRGE